MPIQRVLGNIEKLEKIRLTFVLIYCLNQALLRQEKANYDDVVSHVNGFEEGVIECNNHF